MAASDSVRILKSYPSNTAPKTWETTESRRGARTRDPGRRISGNLIIERCPGRVPAAAGPLNRLDDELIRDPPRDVGGVGLRRKAEGDVPEAGVERFADRVPGAVGPLVRHGQVDRPDDGGRITADLAAVPA